MRRLVGFLFGYLLLERLWKAWAWATSGRLSRRGLQVSLPRNRLRRIRWFGDRRRAKPRQDAGRGRIPVDELPGYMTSRKSGGSQRIR